MHELPYKLRRRRSTLPSPTAMYLDRHISRRPITHFYSPRSVVLSPPSFRSMFPPSIHRPLGTSSTIRKRSIAMSRRSHSINTDNTSAVDGAVKQRPLRHWKIHSFRHIYSFKIRIFILTHVSHSMKRNSPVVCQLHVRYCVRWSTHSAGQLSDSYNSHIDHENLDGTLPSFNKARISCCNFSISFHLDCRDDSPSRTSNSPTTLLCASIAISSMISSNFVANVDWPLHKNAPI